MAKTTKGKAKAVKAYQIKITLKHCKPPIWRRVLVRSDMRLDELHEVIQAAMGWYDGHLHQFVVKTPRRKPTDRELSSLLGLIGGFDAPGQTQNIDWSSIRGEREFAPVSPDGFGMIDEGEDESTVRLDELAASPKATLLYEYDFGDGWEHEILVEKITPLDPGARYPLCIKGKRACPPEDCGGPWGYAELLEAIGDPTHPQHDHLNDWAEELDPEHFNPDEINQRMDHLRSEG